jgi:hypothetical protein
VSRFFPYALSIMIGLRLFARTEISGDLVAETELPPTRRRQVCTCREGSSSTLAYQTNVMFWQGQRQKPRMAYLSGLSG